MSSEENGDREPHTSRLIPHPSKQHPLQDIHTHAGLALMTGAVRLRVWMKILRSRSAGFLRITMAVGDQRQQGSGMVPAVAGGGIGHPTELPQRQRAGVDTGDAGEFVAELPDVNRLASSRAVSIA